MKKLILIFVLVALSACNFQASDSTEELPSKYQFIEEGGSQNRILRDNQSIIDSGVVDFSFDDKFIFFSIDTTYSMEPKKIAKEKLIYYVHNIQKDTFSKPINYNFIKKIISQNKIEDENNILLKK
ncbi:hypothetical protein BWK59_14650 [Flavobacterium davisii]|uniref:Lipoprotein n=1 Tax=Flavobacterium davisii TaxID=2906077 RepID=A0A246GEV1_9FLAO|nr:hypothetical protein [Flavobacterium davisii]OWP82664.1 hypothetical protein BWK59_14650 [Flavobacterium davisii]